MAKIPITKHNINEFGEVKVNIEIGGKQTDKFVPNMNFSYECRSEDIYKREHYFFNINAKDITITDEIANLSENEIELELEGEKHKWKPEGKDNYEWEIEFESRPSVNQWEWAIDFSKDIHFSYQDTLENDFYNYGGEGYKTLEEFLANAERPDNVVGSYSIYGNKRDKVKDVEGRVKANFSTGKLGSIYAPYFTDKNGDRKKGILEIEIISPITGILRVIGDKNWLDNAIYPAILDPNFGNEDIGASSLTLEDAMRGVSGTPTGGDGTLDYLYMATKGWGAGEVAKMALYLESGAFVTNSGTGELTGPQTESVHI